MSLVGCLELVLYDIRELAWQHYFTVKVSTNERAVMPELDQ